ncbi:hypothetical protein B0H13DRAFT_1910297 [Mycena leptocephala]|nr:hypothetical protein B0H13DRAFT_1910297 [Mycena leptocephala]
MQLSDSESVDHTDNTSDDAASGQLSKAKEPLTPTLRMPRIETESGVTFNSDKPTARFDMDVEQYTQFAKGKVVPVSCSTVDSPRWKDVTRKPVPFPGKYVSISGHLIGVEEGAVSRSPYKAECCRQRHLSGLYAFNGNSVHPYITEG